MNRLIDVCACLWLQVVSFNWSPDKEGLACMAVLDQVRGMGGGSNQGSEHPLSVVDTMRFLGRGCPRVGYTRASIKAFRHFPHFGCIKFANV